MICVDKKGKVVIHTDIEIRRIDEIQCMKKAVLRLLATQNKDFHDPDENYWAFELVNLLEVEPEQINIKSNE